MNHWREHVSFWLQVFQEWVREPLFYVFLAVVALLLVTTCAHPRFLPFILKSLRRNVVRTVLTSMAIMFLVLVVTAIWTVLKFMNEITQEKARDLKVIVTERWQIPSQMPYTYYGDITRGPAKSVEDKDHMAWAFYGGTIDPDKRDWNSQLFFFSMQPNKFMTMMDGVDELTPTQREKLAEALKAMELDKRKCLIGAEKLKGLNKRVGERITVTSVNFREIDLEFEIAGELPAGRYGQSSVMNQQYLLDALEDYKKKKLKPHPMDTRNLNLVWLRVPDSQAFEEVTTAIETSSLFSSPAVKCERASSAIASFLDAYKDLLWGMRWLLAPAILVTLALVISNAISISVRERRTEMAVLKVLGFTPNMVLCMVLGEALLVGVLTGLVAEVVFYTAVQWYGGIPFQVAFFPKFRLPEDSLWWGPMLGGLTAFAGSIVPAWSARSVKVSEVFSKIA
jgi:putative ABC transport system permease protein